jgi:hypothetical protein
MELEVSLPQSIDSTFSHHALQSLLILTSYLLPGLPCGFSFKSPKQNYVYTLPLSYTCHMPYPSYSCFNTPIIWAYRKVEIARNSIKPYCGQNA